MTRIRHKLSRQICIGKTAIILLKMTQDFKLWIVRFALFLKSWKPRAISLWIRWEKARSSRYLILILCDVFQRWWVLETWLKLALVRERISTQHYPSLDEMWTQLLPCMDYILFITFNLHESAVLLFILVGKRTRLKVIKHRKEIARWSTAQNISYEKLVSLGRFY